MARDNLMLFLLLFIGGFIIEEVIESLYYRLTKKDIKRHNFALSRYIYLLILPLISVVILSQRVGTHLLNVFLFFTIVGPIIEWSIGFFYHQIVGQRLWTYHRYSISGYTSLLAIPFWGLGGVFFWLLTQALL